MTWHCQMPNGNGDIANGSPAFTTGETDGPVINSGTTRSQPSSRCATPGRAWRDAMPEALEASPTAECLDEVLDLLEDVDWQYLAALVLPRGFGRDERWTPYPGSGGHGRGAQSGHGVPSRR